MKEFLSILAAFVLMAFADAIDEAFGNAIDVDSIVVGAAFVLLFALAGKMSRVGLYAYRTTRKRESSYILIDIATGAIVGVAFFCFREQIAGLYDLTQHQHDMLVQLIGILLLAVPFMNATNAMFEMTRLRDRLQVYNIGLTIHYAALIAADLIVFFTIHELFWLFAINFVVWTIDIIYFIARKQFTLEWPSRSDWTSVWKYGLPGAGDRLAKLGFIVAFGIEASYIPTELYAIHNVCLAVYWGGEMIGGAYGSTLLILLPRLGVGKWRDKNKEAYSLTRKFFPVVFVIGVVAYTMLIFIYHGALPIETLFPFIFAYLACFFFEYLYEVPYAMSTMMGTQQYPMFGCFVEGAVMMLVPIAFIGCGDMSLYAFGAAVSLGMAAKYVYVDVLVKRKINRLELNEQNEICDNTLIQ